jgi:hypothetical protein
LGVGGTGFGGLGVGVLGVGGFGVGRLGVGREWASSRHCGLPRALDLNRPFYVQSYFIKLSSELYICISKKIGILLFMINYCCVKRALAFSE